MDRISEQLMTAEQLAEALGVTPAWVRKRTRQHSIPAINLRAGEPGGHTRPLWRYGPERVLADLRRSSAGHTS